MMKCELNYIKDYINEIGNGMVTTGVKEFTKSENEKNVRFIRVDVAVYIRGTDYEEEIYAIVKYDESSNITIEYYARCLLEKLVKEILCNFICDDVLDISIRD